MSKEWVTHKIGKLLIEKNHPTTSNNQHLVLSVTKNGILPQRDYFKKQIASKDNIGYKIIKKDDLVFSPMNLWMGSLDVLKTLEIGIVSPAYKTFSFNKKLCDANFMSYLMKDASMIKKYIMHSEQGASIVRRNFDLEGFLNDFICLPSLSEQQKISSILNSTDNVIKKIQLIIIKLQNLKIAITNDLLSKGICHSHFKESKIGMIPKNWMTKHFSEVTSLIKSGLSRKLSQQDIGLPILNSGNIINNDLDTKELKYWYLDDPQGVNTKNYFLDEGDILLNFINSISQIGKSCIFRDIGRPTIYTTNIFRIKTNKYLSSKFLFLIINHYKFKKEIKLIIKPAVNQASFTKDELLKIRVQVPPIEEQKKIENIIFSLDHKISTITKKLNKYHFLKKSLMNDFLTSKIRVSVN